MKGSIPFTMRKVNFSLKHFDGLLFEPFDENGPDQANLLFILGNQLDQLNPKPHDHFGFISQKNIIFLKYLKRKCCSETNRRHFLEKFSKY